MLSHSFIHTEWSKLILLKELSNIRSKKDLYNKYQWIDYKLTIKRNHAFYVNHIIVPFFILTLLTLFGKLELIILL